MTESVIRQSELRNDNADVMRRVVAGESFVVTVHGRPVADLVPHRRRRRDVGVSLAELRTALARLGAAADEGWRTDIEDPGRTDDLDDAVDDPWARGAE